MDNNENNGRRRRYNLHLRRDSGVENISQSTKWRRNNQLRGEHHQARINPLQENNIQQMEVEIEDNEIEAENIRENRDDDTNAIGREAVDSNENNSNVEDDTDDDSDDNNIYSDVDADVHIDNEEQQVQLLTVEEFHLEGEEEEEEVPNVEDDEFGEYDDEDSDEDVNEQNRNVNIVPRRPAVFGQIEEGRNPDEREERRHPQEQNLPPFDLNFLHTPLYEGSNLTIGETIFMIEVFTSRHGLSKVCVQDFLQMLQVIIGDTNLPKSTYLYERVFSEILNLISYNLLCKECGNNLIKLSRSQMSKEIILCRNCNSANEKNLKSGCYLAMFDLEKQFQMFLEDPEILEALRANEVNIRRNEVDDDIVIKDIYDGSLYRNLKQAGNILNSENNFSVNFNLDGASFFKSSKGSCWPIQLMLNELPIKLRHRRLILGGIWFGKQQPKIDTFLNIFCTELNELGNRGVSWMNSHGETTLTKIVPMCCCVDSVARPKIMESMQYNGKYGCVYCYNPGRVFNRTLKYPYSVDYAEVTQNETEGELNDEGNSYRERTTQEVTQQMITAYETNENAAGEMIMTSFKGLKGFSVLAVLPSFDLLWGCPPDELHGPDEGVIGNTLFEYWFNRKKSNPTFYIGHPRALKEINNRMKSIKPPREIHRLPGDISQRKNWKATEYKSFLLYYGIPSLRGILPARYLNHFSLLVEGIQLLLQPHITSNDIQRSRELLNRFVRDFEILYGPDKMTYNVHSLLHFPTAVEKCGPLIVFSTYAFESNLGKIKRCVHSSNGVSIQVAEKVARMESLSVLRKHLELNERVDSFVKRILTTNSRPSGLEVDDNCVMLGCGKMVRLNREEISLLRTNGIEGNRFTKYTKIIFNGRTYTSIEHTKAWKRDNNIAKFVDGTFGKIMRIILVANECKLFVKKINTEAVTQGDLTVTHMRKISVMNSNQITLFRAADIAELCVHIQVKPASRYICKLLNHHEVQ